MIEDKLCVVFCPAPEWFFQMQTSISDKVQNLGLCSAPTALEFEGIFIVPHTPTVTRGQ